MVSHFLRELGVNPTGSEIEEMAAKCAAGAPGGTVGVVRPLEQADMAAIYRAAL